MQSMVSSDLRSLMYATYSQLTGLTGKKEGKTRLMNIVMQVRSSTDKTHIVHYSKFGLLQLRKGTSFINYYYYYFMDKL